MPASLAVAMRNYTADKMISSSLGQISRCGITRCLSGQRRHKPFPDISRHASYLDSEVSEVTPMSLALLPRYFTGGARHASPLRSPGHDGFLYADGRGR